MIDVDSREARLQLLRQLLHFIETGQLDGVTDLARPAIEQAMPALSKRLVPALAGEQVKAEYFIRHGASEAQLREYFGLTRETVRKLRRTLRPHHGTGRPALPKPELAKRIADVWEGLQGGDAADRYMRLHQAFPAVSIAALETVVRACPHSRQMRRQAATAVMSHA